jgi:hypothetical protein
LTVFINRETRESQTRHSKTPSKKARESMTKWRPNTTPPSIIFRFLTIIRRP